MLLAGLPQRTGLHDVVRVRPVANRNGVLLQSFDVDAEHVVLLAAAARDIGSGDAVRVVLLAVLVLVAVVVQLALDELAILFHVA